MCGAHRKTHSITEFDPDQLRCISTDLVNILLPTGMPIWRCRCRAAVRAGMTAYILPIHTTAMDLVVYRPDANLEANIVKGGYKGPTRTIQDKDNHYNAKGRPYDCREG